jgi:hypothetical protein
VRHLRLYRYDHAAAELVTAPVSSALMPGASVAGTRLRAKDLVGPAHQPRRAAAHGILSREVGRAGKPRFYAVALVACPSGAARRRAEMRLKQTLTPTSAYAYSFAIWAPWKHIYLLDGLAGSLEDVRAMIAECVRGVLVDRWRPGRAAG